MSKPALIIIHGWGSNRQKWAPFMKLAQNDFDVYFISLPCFDGVACPKEVWGVEEYANFVRLEIVRLIGGFADEVEDLKLNSKNTVLLGHSFGGAIATQLVADNPDMFERLVLVAAAVVRPKIKLKRMIFGTFAKIGNWVFEIPFLKKYQKLAKKVLYKGSNSPDYAKTSGMQREIFKKIIRQNLTHVLDRIKIPTLVLWGDKDTLTPIKHGRIIGKVISDSTFVEMKGATHGLHYPKYVEETYKHVNNFVFDH